MYVRKENENETWDVSKYRKFNLEINAQGEHYIKFYPISKNESPDIMGFKYEQEARDAYTHINHALDGPTKFVILTNRHNEN